MGFACVAQSARLKFLFTNKHPKITIKLVPFTLVFIGFNLKHYYLSYNNNISILYLQVNLNYFLLILLLLSYMKLLDYLMVINVTSN